MRGITVSLSEVVKDFPYDLHVLYGDRLLSRKRLNSPDLNRPGLLLAGFTREFSRERIQILGLTERAYLLHTLHRKGRKGTLKVLEILFSRRVPAVILTSGDRKLPSRLLTAILEMAEKYRTPVLSTTLKTPRFMALMSDRLFYLLAPRETLHGVMVEIHGVGVLITGKPGIGKSETALELIRRGHRFVADDMVMVKRYPPNSLLAEPPSAREDMTFFIHIRGIGTIYVPHYFGVSAIRRSYPLHIVVALSEEERPVEKTEILGIPLPKYSVKVHPLKATATVVESMALHYKANVLKDIIRLPDFAKLLEDRLKRTPKG